MIRKQPVHPKLYIKEELVESSSKMYKYLSNEFIDSERVIKKELDFECKNNDSIYKKNKIEYKKLENFIKIQKKVLNKYQKARNYDAENIVKASIVLMENFKKQFDNWFKKNKV